MSGCGVGQIGAGATKDETKFFTLQLRLSGDGGLRWRTLGGTPQDRIHLDDRRVGVEATDVSVPGTTSTIMEHCLPAVVFI